MNIIKIGSYNIPVCSLGYVIKNDASGCSDKEIEEMDEWILDEFKGYVNLVYDTHTNESSSDSFFTSIPAYGLPTDCVKVRVHGHPLPMTIKQVKGLKHGQIVYHLTLKNADKTPYRAKVSGKPIVWKLSSDRVHIPVKHGLYDHGYIDENNYNEWTQTNF